MDAPRRAPAPALAARSESMMTVNEFTDDTPATAPATITNVLPRRRQHPYEREVAEAMQLFCTLDAETGWKELPEQQGVQITMKDVPGTPTGVIKGVGFVAGYPPREVLATIQSFEARSEWDGLMETGRTVEILDPAVNTMLNYAVTKKRPPTSGRDVVLAGGYQFDADGTIRSAFQSIKHPRFPENKTYVRMQADLIAWKLAPHQDNSTGEHGTMVTYMSQTNPNGWIPQSVLRMVAGQVPLCVANIAKYMKAHGPPPSITQFGVDVLSYSLDANEDTYRWTATLRASAPWTVAGATRILVSKKAFAGGVTVELQPADDCQVHWVDTESVLQLEPARAGSITVTVRRRLGDAFAVTVNGDEVFPTRVASKPASAAAEAPAQAVPSNRPSASAAPAAAAPRSSKHAYSAARDRLLMDLKTVIQESFSSSVLWEQAKAPTRGVTLSRRPVPAHPLGYVKGTMLINGFTPDQVYAAIEVAACRAQWDGRFAAKELIEAFDERCEVTRVEQPATFVLAARDMCVLTAVERTPEGNVWAASRSVNDERAQPGSAFVRAGLQMGGWYLELLRDGSNGRVATRVTHIVLVDPKGWMPLSVLSMMTSSLPVCIADLEAFLSTRGAPPALVSLAGPLVEHPQFSMRTGRYVLKYTSVSERRRTVLSVHRQRYERGFDLTVAPADGSVTVRQLSGSDDIEIVARAPNTVVTVQVDARLTVEAAALRVNGAPVSTASARDDAKDAVIESNELQSLEAERQRLLAELADLQQRPALESLGRAGDKQALVTSSAGATMLDLFIMPLLALFIGMAFTTSLRFLLQ